MRWVIVCCALWAFACQETIFLGSECPNGSGLCGDGWDARVEDAHAPSPRDDASDPGITDAGASEIDAGSVPDEDAATDSDADPTDTGLDAQPPEDAGPPLYPAIQNPSFELSDGGVEGQLLSFGERNQASSIAPWYACRIGISVSSLAGAASPIEPTDGDTFLTDTFPIGALNINGLNQDLAEPLRAGQRYAFAVDLWVEDAILNGRNLELLAVGTSAGCIPLPVVELGRSGPVEPGGWRRTCIDFTPARDVGTLTLFINAPMDFLNFGARLHVDNIGPCAD